jgi:hypothetical protein
MNATASIQSIEQKIQTIKTQLLALGNMRPGSLSKQYNVCGKPGCRCKDPKKPRRHGPYYQISYVHRGKSTSRFVRPPALAEVKAQLANFKKFRHLTQKWVALALQLAEIKLKALSKTQSPEPKHTTNP